MSTADGGGAACPSYRRAIVPLVAIFVVAVFVQVVVLPPMLLAVNFVPAGVRHGWRFLFAEPIDWLAVWLGYQSRVPQMFSTSIASIAGALAIRLALFGPCSWRFAAGLGAFVAAGSIVLGLFAPSDWKASPWTWAWPSSWSPIVSLKSLLTLLLLTAAALLAWLSVRRFSRPREVPVTDAAWRPSDRQRPPHFRLSLARLGTTVIVFLIAAPLIIALAAFSWGFVLNGANFGRLATPSTVFQSFMNFAVPIFWFGWLPALLLGVTAAAWQMRDPLGPVPLRSAVLGGGVLGLCIVAWGWSSLQKEPFVAAGAVAIAVVLAVACRALANLILSSRMLRFEERTAGES